MPPSDDSYYLERRKKAEKLRKPYGKIWSLFWKPDYYESAEIFEELADGSDTLKEKELLYCECARTFLMEKGEYSHFRAAQVYKKMEDLFVSAGLIAKALEYGELYSTNLEATGRYLMAGQAADNLADLCEKSQPGKAVDLRKRAIVLYEMDGNCPSHMKKSAEKCLTLQLTMCDYDGAMESLSRLNIKYAVLCKHLISLLTGAQVEDELSSSEENRLVRILINKSREEGLRALQDFSTENYLPEYAKHIFQALAGKFSPENDIC